MQVHEVNDSNKGEHLIATARQLQNSPRMARRWACLCDCLQAGKFMLLGVQRPAGMARLCCSCAAMPHTRVGRTLKWILPMTHTRQNLVKMAVHAAVRQGFCAWAMPEPFAHMLVEATASLDT